MTDYTVNATLRITSEADRARLELLLDQGLRELANISARYGVVITESSAAVES